MTIKEFELFHGAVLAKFMRRDRSVNVVLIETHPKDTWSKYMVSYGFNDVPLLIKHSTNQRKLKRKRGACAWTFVFSPDQLRQLRPDKSGKPAYVALVGGSNKLKNTRMQACLLKPKEIQSVVDLQSPKQASLTVHYLPRKKLCVLYGRKEIFLVSQNRLEEWDLHTTTN